MRRLLLLGCAALLAIIGLWYGLGRDQYRNVWEAYAQIREGMSKDEVVALFGVPPGQYSSGDVAICSTGQDASFAAVDKCSSKCVWLFDDGLFEVGFHKDLRVEKKVASANMSGPPTVWDRLSYALGF
jgi:hypothetical protein